MNKNSRGFIQIILILIIVGLAIGGAYYFGTLKNKNEVVNTPTEEPVIQTQKPSTPTVKPTVDPTADWKIYTNSEFSFKYPDTWIIDGTKIYSQGNSIEMWVYKTGDSLYNDCMKIDSVQKINGVNVKSFSGAASSQMCDPVNSLKRKEKWIVKTEGEGFAPGLQFSYKKGDLEAEKIFDQILSTFKFTK